MLVKADALGQLGPHESGMHNADDDALLLQVQGQQFPGHV